MCNDNTRCVRDREKGGSGTEVSAFTLFGCISLPRHR
jgi:hypothetical protein